MIIKFDKGITRQEIYANGAELAQVMGMDKDKDGRRIHTWPKRKKAHVVTFDNPVLVTDNYKIGQLDPSLRDTVFALYSSPVRITDYDGTVLEFEQRKYPGVWGPSIDTLLFCRALERTGLEDVKTAVEVGSGSGFISKRLIEKAPNLEEMTLIDLNKYAVKCSKDNMKDKRVKHIEGNAIAHMEGKKYDLIICNPPYIPRPKSIDDNPYEGISLLLYLISQAGEHLTEKGRLVTNISSLCQGKVGEIIAGANVEFAGLDAMEVPLKVYNVLNNKEWMDFLLNEKGLVKDRHDGYDYWQTITIVEIKPK